MNWFQLTYLVWKINGASFLSTNCIRKADRTAGPWQPGQTLKGMLLAAGPYDDFSWLILWSWNGFLAALSNLDKIKSWKCRRENFLIHSPGELLVCCIFLWQWLPFSEISKGNISPQILKMFFKNILVGNVYDLRILMDPREIL